MCLKFQKPFIIKNFFVEKSKKLANGGTGGGYHGQLAGRLLFSRHFPLGRKAEVYDAEMTAAVQGAEDATRALATHLAGSVHVVLDNLAAVRNLQPNRPSVLSPELVARMDVARKTWACRERAPHVPEGEIKVWWTPPGLKGTKKRTAWQSSGPLSIPAPPCPQQLATYAGSGVRFSSGTPANGGKRMPPQRIKISEYNGRASLKS